jgi:hypothetical protein
MAKVKCADCGFLTARHNHDGSLVEIPADTRETGEAPRIRGSQRGTDPLFDNLPICFVGAHNIGKEAGTASQANFVHVLRTERECARFTEWQSGLDPRGHKEMLDQKALREWQEERRVADRDFQAQQRSEDIERQERQRKEDLEREEARRRNDREWQRRQDVRRWLLSVITAIVSLILGAVLTALLRK